MHENEVSVMRFVHSVIFLSVAATHCKHGYAGAASLSITFESCIYLAVMVQKEEKGNAEMV